MLLRHEKLGEVFRPDGRSDWWRSHCMAPAPVLVEPDRIRVFLGGWAPGPISRIGWVDVDARDPRVVLGNSSEPVLDLGDPGCFDDNGVFPAHAVVDGERINLFYTGFQLGHRVPHFNFGGLAVSEDGGDSFRRHSRAPVMDRTDEGLAVRAGQSAIPLGDGRWLGAYSAGTRWEHVGGKLRPTYDVHVQELDRLDRWGPVGRKVLACDHSREHGLGRPQLVRLGGHVLLFYTRRTLDMRYHLGCAVADDELRGWERIDDQVAIPHGAPGSFDEGMVYFPAVVDTPHGAWLFYSGNDFGEALGVARLEVG